MGKNIVLTDVSAIKTKTFIPCTLFPVFNYMEPRKALEIDKNSPEIIPIGFFVESKLRILSASLTVDGNSGNGVVSMNRISTDKVYIKYLPNAPWDEGEHAIKVTAMNEFLLEESKEYAFRVVAVDSEQEDATNIVDTDKDGLPDDWEIKYFGNLGQSGDGDFDGDGLSNSEEYRLGTNPVDPDDPKKDIEDKWQPGKGNPETPTEKCRKKWPVLSRVNFVHDPNEMQGPEGQITPGQELVYTVTFENVGEGIAYGVYVSDKFDKNIDDSYVMVTNAKRVDFTAGTEMLADFEYKYDPGTRILSVFVDNGGELGSRQGGKFDIRVRAKSTALPGTEIGNYATVFFPSVPEETPTNTIISVVPKATNIQYSGSDIVEYSDSIELSTMLLDGVNSNTLSKKNIVYSVDSSTISTVTGEGGISCTQINPTDLLPGNYAVNISFPGDNLYYTASTLTKELKIVKKNTILSQPNLSLNYQSSGTVITQITDTNNVNLKYQENDPKTVFIDYQNINGWQQLARATVVGSSVTLTFSFPEKPTKLQYRIRARFDGDTRYRASTAEGKLYINDVAPPEILISSPTIGAQYAVGVSSVPIHFSITDLDTAPTIYAFITDLQEGTTVSVVNGQYIDPVTLKSGFWALTVKAIDWSGNSSSATIPSFEVIHDTQAPIITILSPRGGEQYIAGISSITIRYQVTDGFSTNPNVVSYLTSLVNGTTLQVVNGQIVNPLTVTTGYWTLTVQAEDDAKNSISQTTGGFEIIHDIAPPVSTLVLSNPKIIKDGETYIASTTLLSIIVSDDLTVSGDAAGLGVKDTWYAIDNDIFILYKGTFTLVNDGEHTVRYYSTDRADGRELTRTFTCLLDNTKPVTTINLTGSCHSVIVDSKTFVSGQPGIVLAAADPANGNVSVGVKETQYRFNDSAWNIYLSTITTAIEGAVKIEYLSADELGNKEDARVYSFFSDNAAPEVNVIVSTPNYVSGYTIFIGAGAEVEFNAGDAGSGMDSIIYSLNSGTITYTAPIIFTDEGEYRISYSAADRCGNVSLTKNVSVSLDTTPPQSRIYISSVSSEGGSSVKFIMEALDPLSREVHSGIKAMRYRIDSGDFVVVYSSFNIIQTAIPDGVHTVSYQAIDNANNIEPLKYLNAIYDSVKPTVRSTYPANKTVVRAKNAVPIRIVFSEQAQCPNWNESICIKEKKGRIVKGFSIIYDTATCTLIINGCLKNNTEYVVTLYNTITDKAGNRLDEYIFSFQTYLHAPEGGTIFKADIGLTIIVPPNALSCDGYFKADLVIGINLPPLANPLQWILGDRVAFELVFKDTEDKIVNEPVSKPIELVILPQTTAVFAAPNKDQLILTNLKLCRIDTIKDAMAGAQSKAISPENSTKAFVPIPMSVSKDQNITTLSAKITSLGVFSIAGFNAPGSSLEDLSCYPNPFSPAKNSITIQYFLQIDSKVGIAVYDLLGNLVKTWEISSGDIGAQAGLNQLSWDGRNGAGETVANGGYILFVHSDGQNKKFKILVIK